MASKGQKFNSYSKELKKEIIDRITMNIRFILSNVLRF